MLFGLGQKAGNAHHGPLRLELFQLFPVGAAEELAGEESLPGEFAHDLHVEPVARVRPGVGVYHVDFIEVLQVGPGLVQQFLEGCGREWFVYVAPGHGVPGNGVLHDKAVLRGPAGALAGFGDEGAGVGDHAFPTPDGGLHEPGRRQVFVYGPKMRQPETFQRHLANS